MSAKHFLFLVFQKSGKFISDDYTLLIDAGHEVRILGSENFEFTTVLKELKVEEQDRRVILINDTERVHFSKNALSVLRELDFSDAVMFAASSWFNFEEQALHYYYWKHYLRPHTLYNYLDSSICYGTVGALTAVFESANTRYSSLSHSFQDAMSRYYVDVSLGCFENDVDILLDHNQEYFSSTFWSSLKSSKGWLFDLIYRLNERNFISHLGANSQSYLQNIELSQGQYTNTFTGGSPGFVAVDRVKQKEVNDAPIKVKLSIWRKTLADLLFIGKVNKWVFSKERIFRWKINKSYNLTEGTRTMVERLEMRLPLSFAHYNDGELTFIRDYLAGDYHEKWFGRQQQQFDPLLAERLYKAMQYQKEGYFIGVPCSVDHRKLREEADAIVGDYDHKVQAMSLHHNLYFMPRILEALKGRTVYFFTNEFQDLSFFSKIGVEVNENRVIKVPYKNSYLEYDKYKNMEFLPESVVVLTCGMLAKILTKVWFENNDRLTVLALGASLDDHIQKEKSGLNFFPEDYPVTKNVKKYRAFLFGPKKRCVECFDF